MTMGYVEEKMNEGTEILDMIDAYIKKKVMDRTNQIFESVERVIKVNDECDNCKCNIGKVFALKEEFQNKK